MSAILEAPHLPLADALDLILTGLDQLTEAVEGGELQRLDTDGLMQFVHTHEELRNRMSVTDHAIVTECEARHLDQVFLTRGIGGLLSEALHLSRAESARRVRAAHALSPRTTLAGQVLPAARPILRSAQRDGGITPEQASVILDTLRDLDAVPGVTNAQTEWAERTLTANATTFATPRDLRRLAERIDAGLNPDGSEPRDEQHLHKRGLSLTDVRGGGATISGFLNPDTLAAFRAALDPYAAPRPADISGADRRNAAQRWHDALGEGCHRLLRSGILPATGGTPATIIITMRLQDLQEHLRRENAGVRRLPSTQCRSRATATLSTGEQISIRDVLRLAGESKIIPAVLDTNGVPMHLGTGTRIATESQTWALIARDGGCIFPGCDQPPEHCERHHITDYAHGGPTDLNNLALLCGYHHDNHARRGFTIRTINGLPHVVPPPWIDPDQSPLLHDRIRLRAGPDAPPD